VWEHGSLYTGEGGYQQAASRKGADLLLSLNRARILSACRKCCLSTAAGQSLDYSNSRFLEGVHKAVEENLESKGKEKDI